MKAIRYVMQRSKGKMARDETFFERCRRAHPFDPCSIYSVHELNQEFERLYIESTWSQARVARELSLDPSVISRYRKDQARPSLTVLGYFAAKLGQRLLIPGVESSGQVSDGPAYLEPYEREFLNTVQRFHPTQRREILKGFGLALAAIAQPVTYAEPNSAAPPPAKPRAAAKVDQRKIEKLAKEVADHMERAKQSGGE